MCLTVYFIYISVMHHGAIVCGVRTHANVHDLCCYHHQGSCRHGVRCTFAHQFLGVNVKLIVFV